MERLGHIIEEAVTTDVWKPIQLSRGGPFLSHLFYADDLIIFGQASVSQAAVVSECLDRFCEDAGQAVNKGKSAIFCSRNTDRQTASNVATALGIPLTQNLGSYLGVPILHERITNETYQEILNRLDKKLSGWKVKTLSLAGRVTLAKSVLSAIPAYAMQTSLIPTTTCEAIDKKIRDFVWGSSDQERKIHLVSWDRICAPKSEGGLGLRLASHLNRAYMTKLAYLFFTNEEALWVRILQSKYFKDGRDGLVQKKLPSKSAVWRGISREWATMTQGIRALIHDGAATAFWTARWVDSDLRLIEFANTEVQGFNIDDSVADFVDENGSWDLQKLTPLLQPEGLNMVAGSSPPVAGSGEDDWCWGGESNGHFSIKSAYELLRSNVQAADTLWDKIWRWKGPARVNHFLWLAAQNKLLTNSQRVKRKIASDGSCGYCQDESEDVIHILRDCRFAKEVWELSGIQAPNPQAWQVQRQEWLRIGITSAELQARNWEIRLQHTYREANKAADHLANRGHSLPLGDHSVPTSDPELGFILRYDCYGISELRTITIND
ncbi:Putative ribonuclease H protein At1g65750 [Linum perenne]